MVGWKESSKMGFMFEDFCLKDLIEKKYPLAYKNMKKEEYSYYDIVLLNKSLVNYKTLECKFDKMASETGNICIETGCNGKLSGLLITKADYWIIGDGITVYIIETKKIYDCIIDNINNIRYIKDCDVLQEDNVSKCMNIYLIPKRIFEKYCCEVSDINNLKYNTLIA